MLPSELQKEAVDFIDFLLTRKNSKQKKKPKLDWIGGLKEYRSQYTSLELQEKAESVRYFFQAVDIEKTFMTDLALHSIGIILFRLDKYELFTSFMEDMIINGMEILSSLPEDLMKPDKTAQQYNLNFDDAYQYMLVSSQPSSVRL